jgi:hypothetical protein
VCDKTDVYIANLVTVGWDEAFAVLYCNQCADLHGMEVCAWCAGPLAGNRRADSAVLCGDCTREPRDRIDHFTDAAFVKSQTGCTTAQAMRALDAANENLVVTIMSLGV